MLMCVLVGKVQILITPTVHFENVYNPAKYSKKQKWASNNDWYEWKADSSYLA